jgi:hypothetical protein
MNVSQKKSLTLQTEFAECALRDYFPSRGCDAALVKMVWQNVDQSKRKQLIISAITSKSAAAQAAVEE